MRFVVYGAGAIGGVVAARLFQKRAANYRAMVIIASIAIWLQS